MAEEKDEPVLRPSANVEITTVGRLVSTTYTMPDGQRVRVLHDSRTLTRQLLAYRTALGRVRYGTEETEK